MLIVGDPDPAIDDAVAGMEFGNLDAAEHRGADEMDAPQPCLDRRFLRIIDRLDDAVADLDSTRIAVTPRLAGLGIDRLVKRLENGTRDAADNLEPGDLAGDLEPHIGDGHGLVGRIAGTLAARIERHVAKCNAAEVTGEDEACGDAVGIACRDLGRDRGGNDADPETVDDEVRLAVAGFKRHVQCCGIRAKADMRPGSVIGFEHGVGIDGKDPAGRQLRLISLG